MSRRARWWLSHLALATLALAGAVVNALLGQWAVAIMAAALVLVLLRTAILTRAVYQDGWHDGFHEGLRLPMDNMNGTIPDAVIRVAATGCASPEIWERAPELPRRHVAVEKEARDGE